MGDDEVCNPDELQLALGGTGHGGHYGGDGAGGGAGGAGGPGGPAPWELVRTAAQNLPLGQLGRDKPGNAEITPLQVGGCMDNVSVDNRDEC